MINKIRVALKDSLGIDSVKIIQLTTGSYNNVFKITTKKDDQLIFRIYRNKSWPEYGKLEWISNTLSERNIPTAKILYSTRKNEHFKNGFMIQEFINGDLVEEVVGQQISPEDYYKKLGVLMKKIHQIRIPKYGYIGSGSGDHVSLGTFIERDFSRFFKRVHSLKVFSDKDQNFLTEKILDLLKNISSLPPTLIHNDLSLNNVMLLKTGDIILIDWDNAISGCWIQDFAIMTYWMRGSHPDELKREELIRLFLESYSPDFDEKSIRKFELVFHTIQSINLLGYYYYDDKSKLSYKKVLNYLGYLRSLDLYN